MRTFTRTSSSRQLTATIVVVLATFAQRTIAQGVVLNGSAAIGSVGPSTTISDWSLSGGARLDVGDAGVALNVLLHSGSTVNVNRGGRTGAINLGPSTTANIAGGNVSSSGSGIYGHDRGSQAINITNGGVVTGHLHGIQLGNASGALSDALYASVVIDRSSVEGVSGSAIRLDPGNYIYEVGVSADIVVTNGSTLRGGSGRILDVAHLGYAKLTVDASDLVGDVVVDTGGGDWGGGVHWGGTADITLRNGASLTGSLNRVRSLTLSSGGIWRQTAESSVGELILDGGVWALLRGADTTYETLRVQRDWAGSGGTVQMATLLSAGGPLAQQQTDRLLINGNVTTTGPTVLDVIPTGEGALTDVDQNGVVHANEGMSLVQVAGSSRADAFVLRDGYVAAGPWQYTLHAFGPGQTDATQSLLPAGSPLSWDYRLANKFVRKDDPVDNGARPEEGWATEEPTSPGVPSTPEVGSEASYPGILAVDSRPAVVPQVPSYLVAPMALFSYSTLTGDTLLQRLGSLRAAPNNDELHGEIFARYVGEQSHYSPSQSFEKFGYAFRQQSNALQVGGGLLTLADDSATVRAGWALDHGTTRVTPEAVDGNSRAKYTANGVSAWLTWQHLRGWYVDAVVSGTRYVGEVGTDLRRADVARLKANGWTASLETGYPYSLGANWTLEPQLQVRRQALTVRDFTDADMLAIHLRAPAQTSVRVGALLSKVITARWVPYLRLDLSHVEGGQATARIADATGDSTVDFAAGRIGNAYRVGAGLIASLTPNLQLYGEGSLQHQLGGHGVRSWGGNLGVRMSF